jgi:hypothetical protein
MSKIKKLDEKTKTNMSIVLQNLDETINRRMKVVERYNESKDEHKLKIARALEDNVGALVQMKLDIIALEKHSEREIFGE